MGFGNTGLRWEIHRVCLHCLIIKQYRHTQEDILVGGHISWILVELGAWISRLFTDAKTAEDAPGQIIRGKFTGYLTQ